MEEVFDVPKWEKGKDAAKKIVSVLKGKTMTTKEAVVNRLKSLEEGQVRSFGTLGLLGYLICWDVSRIDSSLLAGTVNPNK